MNWLNKFQEGGEATSVAGAAQKLVAAAKGGDKTALKEIDQIMQLAEAIQSAISTDSEDETATEVAKRGTKLKKCSTGDNLIPQDARGKKITKAKCGCGKLHRIGGKIVNIGCDGKILK